VAATFVPPQLATRASKPPTGPGWVHEIKHDGYRMLALVDGRGTRFYSRNKLEWTDRFRPLGSAVERLGARELVLDGEIVIFDDAGRSDFGMMQQALSEGGRDDFHYIAFDLLRINGKDYRGHSLLERKARLRQLIHSNHGIVRFSERLEEEGAVILRHACSMGLEGIISKRADAPYRSGRSELWLKVKCLGRDDFVVGGYIVSSVRGRAFASLLVGEIKSGKLIFRGGVGTGYSEETLRTVGQRLRALEQKKNPFVSVPREYLKGARWIEPQLLAEVKFSNITRDGILRHPSFVGLREDKTPPVINPAIHHR
jgi:bifunctional non-homologous end joining protein LigD